MLDIWKDELKTELKKPESLQNAELIKELTEKIEEGESFEMNSEYPAIPQEESEDFGDVNMSEVIDNNESEYVPYLSETEEQGAPLQPFYNNN